MENMLDKKYKHGRVKEKSVAFKDKDYLTWCHQQDLKCFACGEKAHIDDGIELHHIRDRSITHRDDDKIIPLHGIKCHRLGTELSAHLTPKKFRNIFPVGSQLMYAKKLYERYCESKV